MNEDSIIETLSDLEVFVQDENIRLYYKYVSKLPARSKILDLCTGWGKSVMALALSNPFVLIETMDIGVIPIYNGWAKNEQDYYKKMTDQFEQYQINNINFYLQDVMEFPVKENYYDLIHIDLEAIIEGQALARFLPSLKSGGILIARNYDRFKEAVDSFCQEYEYIEQQGLIQVIKKNA